MKNIKLKRLYKNISYMVIANIVSLLVSFLTILILPKTIGIIEYSYWQLFLFYSSYIVFLSLGWCDGIFLRYGGFDYKDLPKKTFVSQFWCMTIYLFAIIIPIIILLINSKIEYNKKIVLLSTCLYGIIYICRVYYEYILQTTGRAKLYAKMIIIDRGMFCLIFLLVLFNKNINYKTIIFYDIIIKLLTLLYLMFKCYDITFGKFDTIKNIKSEIIQNISVGIKLAITNLVSILIVGIIRISIEYIWDIAIFGKVSFTLSINNIVLVFVNAIGISIFPVLCKTSTKTLSNKYKDLYLLLNIIMFGIIILYYPIKLLMSIWLPQYKESLDYMALLFPIIIFESKMSLIINPCLKSMRKEKQLLKINILTLCVSILTTILFIFIMKNLILGIFSITLVLLFRYVLSNIYLSKYLGINITINFIYEILLYVIFIFVFWYIDSWISVAIYVTFYVIYVFINHISIKTALKNLFTNKER